MNKEGKVLATKTHNAYSLKNATLKFAYDWRELAREHGPEITYSDIEEVATEQDKPKQLGIFEI